MKRLDPKQTGSRAFYSYMVRSVSPRPVALVSTIDSSGCSNTAPFSSFNYMGIEPPLVVFAIYHREDDTAEKDTLLNLREIPEFVLNLADRSMVRQLTLASASYSRGISEFEKAGFSPLPSETIRPFRIAESPVHLECRVREILAVGSTNLVVAEVTFAHISEGILDNRGHIDIKKTQWLGHAGEDWYCSPDSRSWIEIPDPETGIGVDSLPDPVRRSAILSGNEIGLLGSITEFPSPEEIRLYGYREPIVSIRTQTGNVCQNFNELLHLRVKELLREENLPEALLTALQSI